MIPVVINFRYRRRIERNSVFEAGTEDTYIIITFFIEYLYVSFGGNTGVHHHNRTGIEEEGCAIRQIISANINCAVFGLSVKCDRKSGKLPGCQPFWGEFLPSWVKELLNFYSAGIFLYEKKLSVFLCLTHGYGNHLP
jgi:hypothetical protein